MSSKVSPQDRMGRRVLAKSGSYVPGEHGQPHTMQAGEYGEVEAELHPDPKLVLVRIQGREKAMKVQVAALEFLASATGPGRLYHCTTAFKDPGTGNQIKQNDHGEVLQVSPDGRSVLVTVVNRTPHYHIRVPCNYIYFGLPKDAEGRTFRMKIDQSNAESGFNVLKGDYGVVTKLSEQGGDWNVVKVMSRDIGEGTLPADAMEVGQRFGEWKVSNRIRPVAEPKLAPPGFGGALPWHDLRLHISGLLTAIYEQRHLVDWKTHDLIKLIATDADRKQLAVDIYTGIQRASPQLIVLLREAMSTGRTPTWKNIVGSCKVISAQDKYPGAYLRLYEDFKPGRFQGHKEYPYWGQSVDPFSRMSDHDKKAYDAKSRAFNSMHYQICRAARKIRCVLVYEETAHNRKALSRRQLALRLDLVEEVFVLMFRGTRRDILAWVPASGSQGQAEARSARVTQASHNGNALTKIAATSFEKTGWIGQGDGGFGEQNGLNVCQPIGSESSFSGHERVQWTRIELPDRFIFRRSKTKVSRYGDQCSMFLFQSYEVKIDDSGKEQPHGRECVMYFDNSEGSKPATDTKIWVQVEIMKRGRHEVPYAGLGLAGGWDNWPQIFGMGIQIFWNEGKDDWRSRYVRTRTPQVREGQGNIAGYLKITALRQHLMREEIQSPPSIFFRPKPADVIDLRYNFLQQTITGTVLTEVTSRPAPIMDVQNAIPEMQAAGLRYVGRGREVLPQLVSDAERAQEEGKLTKVQLGLLRKRTKCDSCVLALVSVL